MPQSINQYVDILTERFSDPHLLMQHLYSEMDAVLVYQATTKFTSPPFTGAYAGLFLRRPLATFVFLFLSPCCGRGLVSLVD